MIFTQKDIALQRGSNTTTINNYGSGGYGGSASVQYKYLQLDQQATNLVGNNGIIKLIDSNYLITDNGWKFSKIDSGGTFTDLMTLDINGNLSVAGDVIAFGSASGGTNSSGGLIQTVFGYNNLGGYFDDSELTNTFNAYTINQLNSRIVTIENTNYLTGLNSTLITTALGYTPYNNSNPAGYIAGINNTMVLTALGFTPIDTTDARLTNARVASDVYAWAKAASKPSYSWSEIGSKPTLLSSFTNDLGNYGNFVTGSPWTSQGYITSSALTSYVQKSGDVMSGNLTTKGLTITNGTKTVNLIVDTNGYLTIDNTISSTGDVMAFGSTTGGTSTSGLIETVFGYSNLGSSFSNSDLTDTFNAYTINQMNNRLVSVENGSLTSISSALVTNALGFTPIANTDSRLSDARAASDVYSWAKQSNKPYYNWSEIGSKPTTLSSFTNDLGNYGGWITGINSTQVVNALGYTPVNTTDARLTNARVASDVYAWAKAASKPSYSYSEISSKPTNLTQFTNDLGNYGSWITTSALSPYQLTSTAINTSNIGSQKVDGSLKLWAESHPTSYYLRNNWDGTYWQLTSNHSSPVSVGHSDSANYANSAGSTGVLTGSAHTNGSDGWFRSANQAGWYNETYSVGIYATEAGNVRTYNGANFISSGNISASGEISAYSSSDERLKQNIQPLNKSLELINKLNPVSYNWNDKAKELNPNKTDKTDVGVIAQELKEVLPNLVHNIYNDEFLAVDYVKIIPYLIGAIQELTQEINTLKNNK